jgi:carboxyl-terminal processing protease
MSDPIPDTPTRKRRGSRAVVVTTLFVVMLGVSGWFASRQAPAETAARQALAPRSAAIGAHLFDQVMAAVAQRYVDSINVDTLYAKAVTGVVSELGDPYSLVLTPQRVKSLGEQLSGNYTGVGMQVNKRDGYLTVIEPFAGGPAEKAGLQMGDRIVAIEGVTTFNMLQEDASKLLRGTPGSKVNITVERPGLLKRLQVTLARDAVHRPAVPRITMLADGVGYVDIKVFGPTTSDELAVAVDSLVKKGAKSLIIDLRGNPGGLLEQGVAVSELFLDPGQEIVQLRSRPGVPSENYGDRLTQRWPTLALAVLVDHSSASASEIVAGALQDHDRAIVVGTASFGKGSAQTIFNLPNGGGLRLTTSRWYTPSGRSISKLPPALDASGRRLPRDTVRPTFNTDAGRVVLGGGGINPDVIANDSVAPLALQALTRAMGTKLGDLRNAIAEQALAIKRGGKFTTPNAPITPDMLNNLYADLVRRKVAPERSVYDAATEWVARSLGYETTRVAFGVDAEFMRRAQDDLALQKASQLLQGARTPREVFAHLESAKKVEVPTAK